VTQSTCRRIATSKKLHAKEGVRPLHLAHAEIIGEEMEKISTEKTAVLGDTPEWAVKKRAFCSY
jgi:hypothetical protein